MIIRIWFDKEFNNTSKKTKTTTTNDLKNETFVISACINLKVSGVIDFNVLQNICIFQ